MAERDLFPGNGRARAAWAVWSVAATALADPSADLSEVRRSCEEGDPASANGWARATAIELGLTQGELMDDERRVLDALLVYALYRPPLDPE